MSKTSYSAQTVTTRPANTTPAYDANDVVGATAAVWKFNNIGPAGGRVGLVGWSLRDDVSAVPAGMTSFRLHLYDRTPASALADKAAFDLVSTDLGYQGYIDLGSPADLGSSLYVQNDQQWKAIQLRAGCSDLWGYLVTAGTYTPASAEVLTIALHSLTA
jgi:hypothetical protein